MYRRVIYTVEFVLSDIRQKFMVPKYGTVVCLIRQVPLYISVIYLPLCYPLTNHTTLLQCYTVLLSKLSVPYFIYLSFIYNIYKMYLETCFINLLMYC
jgi:hypothetical protein